MAARWTCPRCDRQFARANQSHTCYPGNSVARSFEGRPRVQREIYDVIIGFLRSLGPVHEDAVQVGVFLKRSSKLAEVRPMARALSLTLYLSRVIDDRRIFRHMRVSSGRTVHDIRLTSVDQVDEQLCDWLTEAYDESG